ncbi:caspase family protein [Actinoplanes subtropicus]|uniref:caspase family protein n=1 Tax=Actinoplanes subtropicus TaxID=543632 RepID=UPI0004C37712|nr:caspase family protein [Actinoplanes subtropicus]
MTTLYALLVGINEYADPDVPNLRGCVNDVEAVEAYLTRPDAESRPRIKVLRDGEASRAAVVEAIRTHLGRATPADAVLFWFSGHGSDAACPDWAWFAEPTRRLQTLVCADSRTGEVPDLWDKELSVLLDDVGRHAAHVAVVLDSCHSDGATREIPTGRTSFRNVPEAAPRIRASLVPELIHAAAAADRPEHIALAACRSTERAREIEIGGRDRGVFSWSLLRALEQLSPLATYRELAAAARTEVEQRVRDQTPQLRPAASPLADHAFLSPRPGVHGAAMRMRYLRGDWEIDAGAVHGLPAGEGLQVGVRGGSPSQQATVTTVQTHRSLVRPDDGWAPARDRQYPMVVTQVPLPRLTVSVTGRDPAAVRRLLLDLHTAAPGGRPSPHVRDVEPGSPADLRADVDPSGMVGIDDDRGRRRCEVRAEEAVGALEHIARWTLLSTLVNPRSELAGAVRIEVLEAPADLALAPRTGGSVLEPTGGELTLSYLRDGSGRRPPEVFLRLHNTSDRELFCVLLDLTPRFRVHAALFPGDFIAPRSPAAVLAGRRVQAYLPDGMAPEPGARARDRLLLLVAEQQFSAEPFLLPQLGGRLSRERSALTSRGLLERIGNGVVLRDLGEAETDRGAYDWTVESLTLVTEVPD